MSEVEADLGVALFIRGRNGARLTSAGEEVVRRARVLVREHNDLRIAAKGGGLFQGRLRLGVLPSIGPYLLPEVVKRLHQEHPTFRLVVREESTRDLDEGLRNGRLDMIISTPEDHPGTQQTTLFEERFWAAVATDHTLSRKKGDVTLKDLAGLTFLTLGPKHRISYIVASLASRAGGRVSDEYEGTSLDAIRLMAVAGAGVAILPEIYAATEYGRRTNVALRYLQETEAKRDIVLIQPMSSIPRKGDDILVEILRGEAARIMATLPRP